MKIIKKASLKDENEFINEVELLRQMDHPNVLKYYEWYSDQFNYYIVTEFCPGGELLGYIIRNHGVDEY